MKQTDYEVDFYGPILGGKVTLKASSDCDFAVEQLARLVVGGRDISIVVREIVPVPVVLRRLTADGKCNCLSCRPNDGQKYLACSDRPES